MMKEGREKKVKYNSGYVKYILDGAISSDVFTEKLTLLQEFLKSLQQFAAAD